MNLSDFQEPRSENPLVSIIITYYNQEPYIRKAVMSASHQTYQNIEIIVVDDGSATPLRSPLDDIAGIRVLRKENGGCPAARNFGFKHSRGTYLVFLDGDDELFPNAVSAHLKALAAVPDAGFVFGAVQYIDDCGEPLPTRRLCRPRRDYLLMFLESNPIASPGSVMIRRSEFEEVGLFDETFLVVEDYDLYLRLLRITSAVLHREQVARYRRHSCNLSLDYPRMLTATYRALNKVGLANPLSKRERRHIERGKRRWAHVYGQKRMPGYMYREIYFKGCAMLNLLFGI
jgi:glycosyltransferase involved in cell wall biosynthesis